MRGACFSSGAACVRGETFGNVNAEAMIFKKPVLTHSTPFKGGRINEKMDNAQIEIVDHMKTGMVANYPKDVVVAVEFFVRNPGKIAQFGEAGYRKVMKEYEAKSVVRRFENIVADILKKKEPKTIPSRKEVEHYFKKEYDERLHNKISVSGKLHRLKYKIRKALYKPVEFLYLAFRYLLREKFGKNLED